MTRTYGPGMFYATICCSYYSIALATPPLAFCSRESLANTKKAHAIHDPYLMEMEMGLSRLDKGECKLLPVFVAHWTEMQKDGVTVKVVMPYEVRVCVYLMGGGTFT